MTGQLLLWHHLLRRRIDRGKDGSIVENVSLLARELARDSNLVLGHGVEERFLECDSGNQAWLLRCCPQFGEYGEYGE